MLNAEKFRDEILEIIRLKRHWSFDLSKNTVSKCNDTYCHNCLFKGNCTVKRYEWMLSEYKEPPILDDVEREYLSKVCEPYNVVGISKYFDDDVKSEFIDITILRFDGNEIDHIVLPEFKANSMYKGMEPSKDYDAKELGIKCKNNPNGEIKHE